MGSRARPGVVQSSPLLSRLPIIHAPFPHHAAGPRIARRCRLPAPGTIGPAGRRRHGGGAARRGGGAAGRAPGRRGAGHGGAGAAAGRADHAGRHRHGAGLQHHHRPGPGRWPVDRDRLPRRPDGASRATCWRGSTRAATRRRSIRRWPRRRRTRRSWPMPGSTCSATPRWRATRASRASSRTRSARQVAQYEAHGRLRPGAIDSARTQLSFTTIRSPIDGRVGLRLVDQGNLVRSGDATGIVTVSQLQPIAVTFTLPQQEIGRVLEALGRGSVPVRGAAAGRRRRRQCRPDHRASC